MSYKHLLLERHFASAHTGLESSPLDYIALRNRDALRAWHQRSLGMPASTEADRKRRWMRRLAFWAHSDAPMDLR